KLFILILIKFLRPKSLGKISVILNNQKVEGYFIGIFLTAEQMLGLPKEIVQKKINQSLKLAIKLNIGIVGLGGMTSPATNGGLDLVNKFNLGVTTGNAYTVITSIQGLLHILKEYRINVTNVKFCVIGATGSVGQGISLKISSMVNNLLLIGRTQEHLEALKKEILNYNNIKVEITKDISLIKDCDVIIIATSSTNVIIDPLILKQNAIIYDISQPKNVSRGLNKIRQDILVMDGGLVELPNLTTRVNLFLPPLTIYGCLAETILLASEKKFDNFAIGKVDLNQINIIEQLGLKYNFKPKDIKIT
ncbi:MAG TPA: hypothetical protein DEP92_04705, partial [Candidatus Komeilibacteria bacterium]|nr:hypothetical protein [Candidatus Komeilibacteria bacterium]